MEKQSARMYFQGNDHKDIMCYIDSRNIEDGVLYPIMNDFIYHNSIFIGKELAWSKMVDSYFECFNYLDIERKKIIKYKDRPDYELSVLMDEGDLHINSGTIKNKKKLKDVEYITFSKYIGADELVEDDLFPASANSGNYIPSRNRNKKFPENGLVFERFYSYRVQYRIYKYEKDQKKAILKKNGEIYVGEDFSFSFSPDELMNLSNYYFLGRGKKLWVIGETEEREIELTYYSSRFLVAYGNCIVYIMATDEIHQGGEGISWDYFYYLVCEDFDGNVLGKVLIKKIEDETSYFFRAWTMLESPITIRFQSWKNKEHKEYEFKYIQIGFNDNGFQYEFVNKNLSFPVEVYSNGQKTGETRTLEEFDWTEGYIRTRYKMNMKLKKDALILRTNDYYFFFIKHFYASDENFCIKP